jgi:hypothetical protein
MKFDVKKFWNNLPSINTLWSMIPRILRRLLTFAIAFSMVIATIVGAMAVTTDGDDRFTVARGETVEASFLLTHPTNSGSVSTVSSLLFLDDKKSLSYSELDEFQDALVVLYEVRVPEEYGIGRYVEEIKILEGNKEYTMTVTVDIQQDWAVSLSRIGEVGGTQINTPLLILVVVVLFVSILSVILHFQLRGGSSGRK